MTATDRDDRVLLPTRALGAVIIPFLTAAVVLLLVLPADTDATFAWTIEPPITAMLLGSAYFGGIWFFAWVVRETHWHRVWPGYPAVVVFATLLGVATLLHLDRFHHGHPSFTAWAALYATTPVLVLAAFLVNRRRDPWAPDRVDVDIPRAWAIALAVAGSVASVTGLVLFAAPEPFLGSWAWPLTPLTARVVGAVLTLPGFVNVWMLRDRRWSSFRWVFQAQLASLAVMLVSVAVRAGDLRWDRPAAWGFSAGIAASAVAYAVFVARMERRRVDVARAAGRDTMAA
ncbi:hypothetical protein FLP10_04380 [Agromyces intestinalis]|uniref:Uncharacterized protein n=1 Tax=Agromyces intestinalis TaxID=2592652 RepID=A0A5C1YCI5_9MICO|nr:hypothetical protein [Agromyces intestinalis]QEO13741.1 hypothetical protein FLP10_04380 [Agromyces intestinalis]